MPDGAAPSVTLSPRLQTVADAVPVCDTVADIGSDHGYVPLYLLEKKRARHVIVSDLRKGPLATARQNFCRTQCSAQADFRLGSGLEILQADEADGIILAGTQDLPEELAAVGPYLWESRSPLLARHLQRLIQRAQAHRNGLLHAKERSAARQVELYSLEKHIAQWKEMLQQCESER